MALEVRTGDFVTASEIMTEAATWLREIGQPLWPNEEVSVEWLRRRAEPASVLVGYADRAPVVACLLEWEDEMFWPGIRDAGFIHRLAVRRSAAGEGNAAALLDWAAEEAVRRGKNSLRLDCVAARTRLCAFYERCGFERVGTWVREPHYHNALYSRPLGR